MGIFFSQLFNNLGEFYLYGGNPRRSGLKGDKTMQDTFTCGSVLLCHIPPVLALGGCPSQPTIHTRHQIPGEFQGRAKSIVVTQCLSSGELNQAQNPEVKG